jgi:hypothetical protein
MSQKVIDKLRKAHDKERVGPALAEALRDLPLDNARAFIDSLEGVLTAIESAALAIEMLDEAEGGEERAERRDDALTAVEEAVNAINGLPGKDDALLVLILQDEEDVDEDEL